jgi:hypothetical protein
VNQRCVLKRRIEITLEKRRVQWIAKRSIASTGWCESCRERTRFISPDEAAKIAQVGARAIYRSVEAGELHFIETEAGELLVCTNSL